MMERKVHQADGTIDKRGCCLIVREGSLGTWVGDPAFHTLVRATGDSKMEKTDTLTYSDRKRAMLSWKKKR